MKVVITNPKRLAEAERRFHSRCVCRGDLSVCPESAHEEAAA